MLLLVAALLGAQADVIDREARLGAAVAAEIRGQTTPLDSRAARDFVDRLGRRIAAELPLGRMNCTFEIVADGPADAGLHEPIALPGGYIFVPAALFTAAADEAEFAGMLAHSMAHVAARHATRNAARPPVILTSGSVPAGMLRPLRSFELEADLVAAQAIARAGYDPLALARYIERVQPDETPAAMSRFPKRERRTDAIREAAGRLPQRDYTLTSSEFERVRGEVGRLTLPPPRKRPSLLR